MKSSSRKNVLIVCEGKEEGKLFNRIFELYPIDVTYNLYLYNTNVHLLGKHIFEKYIDEGFTIDDLDIIQILKEFNYDEVLDNRYTDILLVFDFDPHDPRFDEYRLFELQLLFSESTDQGQLYINYPMIESVLDFSFFSDDEYNDKCVLKSDLSRSAYKNSVRKSSVVKEMIRIDSTSLPLILSFTNNKMRFLVPDGKQKYAELLRHQIDLLSTTNLISVINTSVLFLKDYNSSIFLEYISG